ncbi:hypothetical protein P7K49_002027 [Saguinus oedipus]|uniref:Sulfhydryl oxidase flavin adenine dinucleotide (FAD) binding domain-containing protein n=1 Tax=Saguinus oedipus TaxID=9490 RepID=A0ABQ9WG79_SAGOE|nr:hypothetical protein P7K49_002027 [Saguinus oedipus]
MAEGKLSGQAGGVSGAPREEGRIKSAGPHQLCDESRTMTLPVAWREQLRGHSSSGFLPPIRVLREVPVLDSVPLWMEGLSLEVLCPRRWGRAQVGACSSQGGSLLMQLFPGRPPVRKLLETLQEWLASLPLDRIPYNAVLDLVNNKMRVSPEPSPAMLRPPSLALSWRCSSLLRALLCGEEGKQRPLLFLFP